MMTVNKNFDKEALMVGSMKGREGPVKNGRDTPEQGQRGSINDKGQTDTITTRAEPNSREIEQKHNDIIDALFDPTLLKLEEYQSVLLKVDRSRRNLLHSINARVLEVLSEDNLKWKGLPRNALDLVEAIVIEKPDLLVQADRYGAEPLVTFHIDILFCVIGLVIPNELQQGIQKTCQGSEPGTCPLHQVHERRRNQCRRKAPDIDKATVQVLPAGNSRQVGVEAGVVADKTSEAACLHGSIDVEEVLRKNKDLQAVLQGKLGSCLRQIMVQSNFDTAQPGGMGAVPTASFDRLLDLCPDSFFEDTNETGFTPLQTAIRLYDHETQSINFSRLHGVIDALVRRHKGSIYEPAGYNAGEKYRDKAAYQLLRELVPEGGGDEASDARLLSFRETEDLLKRACIGSNKKLSDKEAFLYQGQSSGRDIILELSEESAVLNKHYIEMIRKYSGKEFESALFSVNLPYWDRSAHGGGNPDETEAGDENPSDRSAFGDASAARRAAKLDGPPGRASEKTPERAPENAADEADPYVGLFAWLFKSGVRKIFRVEVDDLGPCPHTDGAIRECLRGAWKPGTEPGADQAVWDFGIEVWNWKKLDICSETVLIAAPAAREVHLYSSGNTAVLRGWAYGPELGSLTNLESLTIEIHTKNTRNLLDCQNFAPVLKSSIVAHCQGRLSAKDIKIEYPGQGAVPSVTKAKDANQDGGDRHEYQEGPDTKQKPDDWIYQLRDFRSLVQTIMNKDTDTEVRVAVIDNGARLEGLHGKPKGKTFREDRQEWWVEPCDHGSHMVRCIRDVCPQAKLYIARYDDSRKGQKDVFTTKSVCSALEWAIGRNVDIISMSWTFKMKGKGNDTYEDRFTELVGDAVRLGIIIFASVTDKGPAIETKDYAPVGLPNVIRICSSNTYGAITERNLYAEHDFLLPGEQLKVPGSNEIVSGSSFSTAYAAGLSALVLCCLRARVKLDDGEMDENGKSVAKLRLAKAKSCAGMRTIFKILSGRNADDEQKHGFFVRPYKTLKVPTYGDSDTDRAFAVRSISEELLPRKAMKDLP